MVCFSCLVMDKFNCIVGCSYYCVCLLGSMVSCFGLVFDVVLVCLICSFLGVRFERLLFVCDCCFVV